MKACLSIIYLKSRHTEWDRNRYIALSYLFVYLLPSSSDSMPIGRANPGRSLELGTQSRAPMWGQGHNCLSLPFTSSQGFTRRKVEPRAELGPESPGFQWRIRYPQNNICTPAPNPRSQCERPRDSGEPQELLYAPRTVTQQAKLVSITALSFLSIDLSLIHCQTNAFSKAAEDDLSIWAPAIHEGNPDGVPGSWIQFGSTSAPLIIWVNKPVNKVNQSINHSLNLHSSWIYLPLTL